MPRRHCHGDWINERVAAKYQRVSRVVTTYEKPYSATDHEAITANIPVLGLVKGGRVVPADPADLEGDKALRVKTKS